MNCVAPPSLRAAPTLRNTLRVGVCAVTWAASVFFGRVSLMPDGKGAYHADPKLRREDRWSLTTCGINCHESVKGSAKFMMASRCPLALSRALTTHLRH